MAKNRLTKRKIYDDDSGFSVGSDAESIEDSSEDGKRGTVRPRRSVGPAEASEAPSSKGRRLSASKKGVAKRPAGKAKPASLGSTKSTAKQTRKSATKPKTIKKAVTERQEKAEAAQSKALQAATRLGIISDVCQEVNGAMALPLPNAIVNCNNSEIKIKKVTKPKYFFILPGQLSLVRSGVCGTLENIGTESPIINLEFDTLRKTLKLFGSITSPANSYLLMQFHKRMNQVFCESAYNDVVVFHSFQWIDIDSGEACAKEEISNLEIPSDNNADVEDWSDPPQLGTTIASISLSAAKANMKKSTPRKRAPVPVPLPEKNPEDSSTEESESEFAHTSIDETTPVRSSARKQAKRDYSDMFDQSESENSDEHDETRASDSDDEYGRGSGSDSSS